jgi:hypothetical protein
LVRHDVGARGERRDFAIADVRHARDTDTPTNLRDCRQIERIIGGVAGHSRDGQRQSERIECGERNLQLRQIGPMILAVTELK